MTLNAHNLFDSIEIKDVKREIGTLIKSIRKERKVSQAELAHTLDVSRTTIQNLELGRNFTIDTLLKACKELDLLDSLYAKIVQEGQDIGLDKSN